LALSSDDVLDGNGGTDVIRLDNSAASVTASISLNLVTDIEQIVVFDNDGGSATTAQTVHIILTAGTSTTGTIGITSLTIDGTAITDDDDKLIVSGALVTTGNGVTLNVTGGAGNDSLTGTSNADTLSGGLGADTINGGSGADSITGGSGADSLSGETGNDIISGGDGNDIITDATGNDNLSGNDGDDSFDAGTITYQDTISGGDGTDTLALAGTRTDIDFLNVTTLEAVTLGASSNITLGALAQAAGIVTITGSTTSDIISATAYTVGLTYNDSATQSADTVALGTANDLFVFSGNLGLSSDDVLDGNGGTDVIRLDNSAGSVTASISLNLVTDIEQIVVFDNDGGNASTAQTVHIILTAATSTTGTIGITSLTIDGTAITDDDDKLIVSGALVTTGNGVTLNVTGGAGNDSLTGTSNADTLSGGLGADTIDGGFGADSIIGGSGNDSLTGGSGADTISGGDGADTILGGTGVDSLTGGAGADTFTMVADGTTKYLMDVITDLTLSDDDVITLVNQGTEVITSTALSITGGTLTEYLNLASSGTGTANATISWFVYDGNTYIVQDLCDDTTSGSEEDAATFTDGVDIVVKLTGVYDLQTAFGAASGNSITF
jgi:Ca2+-binding RTX toxin-like protein